MFGFARAQQTAPASQIRRLYVEPFATQAGSEKFREDVISQLRKLNSVSVAADESSADAILGGGEVWIKGYRSHNPQLGKGAPNGTPIYAGFLSIALRDKNGQTLWSYLATLPEASDDVSKDHSTLIVKKLVEALKQCEAPSQTVGAVVPVVNLSGLPSDLACTPEALAGIYLGKIKKWNARF